MWIRRNDFLALCRRMRGLEQALRDVYVPAVDSDFETQVSLRQAVIGLVKKTGLKAHPYVPAKDQELV